MYYLEEYAKKAINIAKSRNLPVVCRCGESPGGTKHIGNFNDNIRSYFIYLLIKNSNYPAIHIQTRDDMDPFRKLPKGYCDKKGNWHLNNKKILTKYNNYIGKPLFFIPSLDNCCKNMTKHFSYLYEKECKKLGLTDTIYVSTHDLYIQGKFNKYIKSIFENIQISRKIILSVEKSKPNNYIPIFVICENCKKITGKITNFDINSETVDYLCSNRYLTKDYLAKGCLNKGTVNWNNGKTKMDWEFEWPAQMLIFNTILEPFGKDHLIGSWPISK